MLIVKRVTENFLQITLQLNISNTKLKFDWSTEESAIYIVFWLHKNWDHLLGWWPGVIEMKYITKIYLKQITPFLVWADFSFSVVILSVFPKIELNAGWLPADFLCQLHPSYIWNTVSFLGIQNTRLFSQAPDVLTHSVNVTQQWQYPQAQRDSLKERVAGWLSMHCPVAWRKVSGAKELEMKAAVILSAFHVVRATH